MEAAPCANPKCGTTGGRMGNNSSRPERVKGLCRRCYGRIDAEARRRAAGRAVEPRWRWPEKAFLRRHYADTPLAELAARFGRSVRAVRAQAEMMGVTRRPGDARSSGRPPTAPVADRIRDIRQSKGLDRPEPAELDRARYAALAAEARRNARHAG